MLNAVMANRKLRRREDEWFMEIFASGLPCRFAIGQTGINIGQVR